MHADDIVNQLVSDIPYEELSGMHNGETFAAVGAPTYAAGVVGGVVAAVDAAGLAADGEHAWMTSARPKTAVTARDLRTRLLLETVGRRGGDPSLRLRVRPAARGAIVSHRGATVPVKETRPRMYADCLRDVNGR